MRFLAKIFFSSVILGAGALILFTRSPDLKANMLEIINPRIKEARLLGELNKNLGKLESRFSGVSEVTPSDEADVRFTDREVLEQARELVGEIETINKKNSGRVRNTVTRILDTFIPGGREVLDSQEPTALAGDTPEPCVPSEE